LNNTTGSNNTANGRWRRQQPYHLKAQAAQIQKVNAQLEVSRPAPQTVLNNQ
jgi:hypothetical protein